VSAQSLYDEATFQSLTSDRRALKPGDSLTVLVVENSSASASANTTTQKTGAITGNGRIGQPYDCFARRGLWRQGHVQRAGA
jgi:flagellar basal body L-ring protein FlgH